MDTITLTLTPFQAGEIERGLDIDAAGYPGEKGWGKVNRIGRRGGKRRPAKLIIPGTQQARDRALYRITSSRDICLNNAKDRLGSAHERRTAGARGRSLALLAITLIEAAGDPGAFSPDAWRQSCHDDKIPAISETTPPDSIAAELG